MTGFPELPPLRSGASVGDSYTGISVATGIMMALYNKKKTGKGKRVDVAMLDTMFAAESMDISADIAAMQNLMKADGLIENELTETFE